jgi:translocation and assembly module TamB
MPLAPTSKRPRRRAYGRGLAVLLCVVFALVGIVPVAFGVAARMPSARAWAAQETREWLARSFGVTARYEVTLGLWPLGISLHDLRVDATDGGPPLLQAERVTVRPRAFSLLGGELDVGDVEVIGPRIRAVVRDGKLQNLAITLPESSGEESDAPLPFASLAITDARVDLDVDGVLAQLSELDVDVTAEPGGALEASIRAAHGEVTRIHPFPGREAEEDFVDEDTLCRLEGRVRLEKRELRVRRLAVSAAVDLDPDPGTRPSCALPASDWRKVELRARALRVGLPGLAEPGAPTVHGFVHARVTPALAHRFVYIPHATGSVELDLEVHHDGHTNLPNLTGTLRASEPGLDGKVFAHTLEGQVAIDEDVVSVKDLAITFGDGVVRIGVAKISPFAPNKPLDVGPVELDGLEFTGLMRDLGIHPHAHVTWALKKGRFEHFRGTLDPLSLGGPVSIDTERFEVFDKPFDDPGRKHMMGVARATIGGEFLVRGNVVSFNEFTIQTARSRLHTTVDLDLRQIADIRVFPDSRVELADVSPLASLQIAGLASIGVTSHGDFGDPHIEGEVSVQGLRLGGDALGKNAFVLGDLERAKVSFVPLVVTFREAVLRKNESRVFAPSVRLAFDEGADVVIDGDVDTRAAPHAKIADLLDIFFSVRDDPKFQALREVLGRAPSIDPRWESIDGVAKGGVHARYVLGGREDRCGGGALRVAGKMDLDGVDLFGERYDDGSADFSFVWDDSLAGDAGMRIDLRSASLRKERGTILASGHVGYGGVVEGSAVATALPLSRLDMLGPLGKMLDGHVSAVASVGGTLRALESTVDVAVSRVRIGPGALPASRFRLTMVPTPDPARADVRTRCGNRPAVPFDGQAFASDESAGSFRVTGQLFEQKVRLDDVAMTRQRAAIVSGKVELDGLDLGILANLIPGVAFAAKAPEGQLFASVDVKSLPLRNLREADASATLTRLTVVRDGDRATVTPLGGPLVLRADTLEVPPLRVAFRAAKGPTLDLEVGGKVLGVGTRPELDLGLTLKPMALAELASDVGAIRRAEGIAEARLRVSGPVLTPRYSGLATVRGGRFELDKPSLVLDDVEADVDVGGGEVRVRRAVAKVGGGTLSVSARMPLRGLTVGAATAAITARGVRVPVADGVSLTTDADLTATFDPRAAEGELPLVEGTVELTSFAYTRPISLNVDLGQLTGRPQRTEVETYDPAEDSLRFRILVLSPKPLRFQNNLVEMALEVDPPGLELLGTNQRYGARGLLRVTPSSKIRLRNTEFDVREGTVRFEDPEQVTPIVDVRATTEYRRYASSAAPDAAGEAGASAAPAATAGQWRITLRASGDVQNLKLDFQSDPPLGQEDIILLLTFGTTRAELDRGLASSLGETVGMEALSALTGADKAVRTIVPILDDFRLGTAYSSRSGRIEPTVTVGKRVTDDVRATVTTGLSESREVRSSVEWRLGRRVSLTGSYDNANDASSSSLGNVGADLRFRLEFE